MDFGDILEKWDKLTVGKQLSADEQTAKARVYDKDTASLTNASGTFTNEKKFRGERRYRLLRKKPDDFIDLHGFNRDEAWIALETFFENSRRRGAEKVLIIHGKGNHGSEGTLRDISRRFIEACSFAGENGYSSAREGGTGATWVILKEDQRSR